MVWKDTLEVPNSRKRSETITYSTHHGEKTRFLGISFEETNTEKGYSILWVKSSAKAITDNHQRQKKIEASEQSLKKLIRKLGRYHLKTRQEIETAVLKSLSGTKDYFNYQIKKDNQVVKKQKKRGRPGRNTQYEEKTKTTYRLEYQVNKKAVTQASLSDGIFPLVHNTNLEDKEVLDTYKKQPYLEKRHGTLKGVNKVAPIYLKKTTRLEAMLFLHFVALMVLSLMERNIRRSMVEQDIGKLPILPQGMNTNTPTWSNLKYFFRQLYLVIITEDQKILKTTLKGLTDLHKKVLKLLKVPLSAYNLTHLDWWRFST